MRNDTFASHFVGFYWQIKGDIWVRDYTEFIQKYTKNAVLYATTRIHIFW